jgi:hypothetical protein
MVAWRDELGRRTRDAVAEAFLADPTYRAGFKAGHPGWDGTIEAMRGDEDNRDLVNTISGDITTAIWNTVGCRLDGSASPRWHSACTAIVNRVSARLLR